MKRVITLISQLASASADTAAFQAQADAANKAAEKHVEDNKLLKKVRRCHGPVGSRIQHRLTLTRNAGVVECVFRL